MTVYVLVASAVYDQGVIGVYESPEDAREAAGRIWPLTDGHHEFSIRQRELGVTYAGQFHYTHLTGPRFDLPPLRVGVEPEPDERMTP